MEKIKVFWFKLCSLCNIGNFMLVVKLVVKLVVTVIGVLSGLSYFCSMFIFPIWKSAGDWKYVHDVWYSWQSLNVGLLAFISSMIAFYASSYRAKKQTEREFIASKAFLPQALSLLGDYLKTSSSVVAEATVIAEATDISIKATKRAKPFESVVPELPDHYKEVFKECIKHAPPDVAKHLAKILHLLQIFDSRLKKMPSDTGNYKYHLNCLCILAELRFLINGLFDFARG
ncbi:MAG: hypothetical protein ACRC7P_03210, partial [Enterovibrio sp.]